MNENSFKAFGVSEKLNVVLKKTSTLEIAFGAVFVVVAAFCFAFVICLLGYNSWGKPFFEFFDYHTFDNPERTFKLFSAVIVGGVCGIASGIFALVSGLNSKKSTNNPVTLLKAKIALRLCGIFYFVVACILGACLFLSFVFWPLILFYVVMIILCFCLAVTKFVETLFFPNNQEILDIHNLTEKQQQKILKQSSRNTFEEN